MAGPLRDQRPVTCSPCINDGVVHTRAEIGRTTGLSRTAVAARVRQLVESGLVVEDAAAATTGGRPAGRLRVDRAGGVVLAAAIGASRTKLGVCDLAGAVLAETGLDLDPRASDRKRC